MIRKNITILVVLFSVMIAYVAKSQEHMKYSVLAIEYIGPSDKPITPIVISDSSAGAEWFRKIVLKRGDSDLTAVHVVSTTLITALIADAERRRGTIQQEQEKAQNSSKTISVTVVNLEGRSSFLLSASLAVSVLDSLKVSCKDDEPLRSDLTHFQSRILPFVADQH